MQRCYVDSESGVVEFLTDHVNIDHALITRIYPDPVVNGVWGVDVAGDSQQPAIVVYLNDADFELSEYLEKLCNEL